MPGLPEWGGTITGSRLRQAYKEFAVTEGRKRQPWEDRSIKTTLYWPTKELRDRADVAAKSKERSLNWWILSLVRRELGEKVSEE